MNSKQAKIVAALQAELAAAEITKAAAADAMLEGDWDDACSRIAELNRCIEELSARRSGYRCPDAAALIAANID